MDTEILIEGDALFVPLQVHAISHKTFRRKIMARIFRFAAGVLSSLACVVAFSVAYAQPYPSRPITLVVAFAAGSLSDTVARHLANDLTAVLKQTVVVENKPGGSQTIAGSYVARARPDGYTLYMANMPAVVAPSIQASLPYQGVRDFAPVTSVVSVKLVLYVAPSLPARNLNEFIALARANPGKYTYGSSGVATPIHLVGEMFNGQMGASTVHIPYKGSNEVLQALVSNQITFGFLGFDGMQFVRNGQLKTLGIATSKRDTSAPDVPTLEEAGLPGFRAGVDFVVVAPKGTPAEVVARLNEAISQVTASETFSGRIKQIGGMEIAAPATPAQTGAYIASQEAKWDAIVKAANIKLE